MSPADYSFDPSVLHDFYHAEELPPLGSESTSIPHQRQATIALLQPFWNTNILESCRQSRATTNTGFRDARYEYLNLDPLSKAWRQQMMKLPLFARLVFDLTLPPRDTCHSPEIYGDQKIPEKVCCVVETRDTMNLVRSIALTTVMRAKSKVVSFDVVFNQEDGLFVEGIKILKGQLVALSQAKGTAEGNKRKNANAGVEVDG
ncbi:hypothetical protein BO82DRAFT_355455 [Aspergillus uvarum CBS 121591]|uniref:Uncharacterized protein n=1 Tax=Aspergillus uvarum CBS 121591 TaxID=1448315 RepID=A0A319C951_9EURO|nr:hypothetical protein BO82DRAFT_355455 [Aspergillus uvarum CBS 121591]PYH80489.1 hypothetical protein BO82DRAFT_355455 [Aspergillus uvarum CBS 121591]